MLCLKSNEVESARVVPSCLLGQTLHHIPLQPLLSLGPTPLQESIRDECLLFFTCPAFTPTFFGENALILSPNPSLPSVHIFGEDFPSSSSHSGAGMWAWSPSQDFIPEGPKVIGPEIHLSHELCQ